LPQLRRPARWAITGEDFTQTVTYEDPETGEIMNYEVDLLKHEWA
jgi:hypothetical protein